MQKYVLTGGPSSGKSSILLGLEHYFSENIIKESAEDMIKLYKLKGFYDPQSHPDFQDDVLKLQIKRENSIPKTKRVFIDRGKIDGLAYLQMQYKKPSKFMLNEFDKLKKEPYDKIFLIENQGIIENNGIRTEDLNTAKELEKLQERNYTIFGYNPIRVPMMKLEDRIEFVLKNI